MFAPQLFFRDSFADEFHLAEQRKQVVSNNNDHNES